MEENGDSFIDFRNIQESSKFNFGNGEFKERYRTAMNQGKSLKLKLDFDIRRWGMNKPLLFLLIWINSIDSYANLMILC